MKSTVSVKSMHATVIKLRKQLDTAYAEGSLGYQEAQELNELLLMAQMKLKRFVP